MSIIFANLSYVDSNVSIIDSISKEILTTRKLGDNNNGTNYYGVDFGDQIGNISISTNKTAEVVFTVIKISKNCHTKRIFTNHIKDYVLISSTREYAHFIPENDQNICFIYVSNFNFTVRHGYNVNNTYNHIEVCNRNKECIWYVDEGNSIKYLSGPTIFYWESHLASHDMYWRVDVSSNAYGKYLLVRGEGSGGNYSFIEGSIWEYKRPGSVGSFLLGGVLIIITSGLVILGATLLSRVERFKLTNLSRLPNTCHLLNEGDEII